MKLHLPGLKVEHRKSGARYRVRVKGNPGKRRDIPAGIGPEHPKFMEYYHAFRRDKDHIAEPAPAVPERSVRWMADLYLEYLANQVEAGMKSPLTLNQHRQQLGRVCDHKAKKGGSYGEYNLNLPQAAWKALHMDLVKTPSEADNVMKAVRAMYRHAIDLELIAGNPAAGVKPYRQNKGGAKPWTAEDLRKFLKKHPAGTTPNLYLTLLMFTGCRIGDACWLGPRNEAQMGGETWIKWQPVKKGSAPMMLPMMEPLRRAVEARTVVSADAYVLNSYGRPYKSSASLGNQVRVWVQEAGLTDRSSHGVRKALADLFAENGMTQYQVMSVLAHTKAETSEVYTKNAERRRMAEHAMNVMREYAW